LTKRYVLSLLSSLRSVAAALPLLCVKLQLTMMIKVAVLLSSGVARNDELCLLIQMIEIRADLRTSGRARRSVAPGRRAAAGEQDVHGAVRAVEEEINFILLC
jgi:hypothetical protein